MLSFNILALLLNSKFSSITSDNFNITDHIINFNINFFALAHKNTFNLALYDHFNIFTIVEIVVHACICIRNNDITIFFLIVKIFNNSISLVSFSRFICRLFRGCYNFLFFFLWFWCLSWYLCFKLLSKVCFKNTFCISIRSSPIENSWRICNKKLVEILVNLS